MGLTIFGQLKKGHWGYDMIKAGTLIKPVYANHLTHISLASHFWDLSKQCKPRLDKTPQNLASDQGLHCLLTGISIRNRIKMEKYIRHP